MTAAPPPPGNPARRVGTGLAGETTRGEDSTIRFEPNQPLEVIGDFEVLAKLGQGGMGAVYRARQVSLDRQVALKILPAEFRGRCGLCRPVSARSAGGGQPEPSEPREGVYLGRGGGLPLHRHGTGRGRNPRPVDQARGAAAARGAAHCPRCGPRAGVRLAHRAAHPSRHQAGEHLPLDDGEVKLGDLGLAKIVGARAPPG